MEFAHAACDGVEPRFELRRDMARRIVPVATRAKGQRKNPAAPRTRQPRKKRRGFAVRRHATLENKLFSGGKMPEIVGDRRRIVALTRAPAPERRIGDQREYR